MIEVTDPETLQYQPTRAKPKKSFKAALLIIAFMIFAAAIDVLVFARTSLQLDEAQSLFQVSRNVPGMLNLVAQDVHVPGYHILLHFWNIIFGNNIVTARYLSVIFFVATIPAVYVLGRIIFNRRVGIYAALLTSISPFMLWYGAVARMYSMLALVTVLHQIVFVKIFQTNKTRYWLLYILLTIIGLYTHYFFAFVLLTEAVFYIFYIKRFSKRSFIKFVISLLIGFAALAPWLLYVYHLGLAANDQPYIAVPSTGDIFDTYAQFLFGFQTDALNTFIVSLWPILVLIAFFTLQRKKKITPASTSLVLMAVLPVLGAFVISLIIKPFFLSRYLIVSLPSLLLIFAWVISSYPTTARRIIQTIVVVGTLALLVVEIINPNTPVKENYQQAVAYVSARATAQDVIVATAPFTIYPIEYYYQGPAKLTTQPIWNIYTSGSVPAFSKSTVAAETNENVLSYQHAWLILSYDQGYNQAMKAYYDSRFQLLSQKTFSPGLTVYEYKIRYDPAVVIP